jgi:hypothetical protein
MVPAPFFDPLGRSRRRVGEAGETPAQREPQPTTGTSAETPATAPSVPVMSFKELPASTANNLRRP